MIPGEQASRPAAIKGRQLFAIVEPPGAAALH